MIRRLLQARRSDVVDGVADVVAITLVVGMVSAGSTAVLLTAPLWGVPLLALRVEEHIFGREFLRNRGYPDPIDPE